MKRILFGLLALAVCVGLMGGAFAYLGDKETAVDNSYTAGTLNLLVDGQNDSNVSHISMDPIAPQTKDWEPQDFCKQWVVKNDGNLPGDFWVEIVGIENEENGIIEPEANAGDVTGGATQGELGSLTWAKFQENDWNDPYPSLSWAGSAQFKPFNSAEGVHSSHVTIPPGSSMKVYLWFAWPQSGGFYGVDNTAQGDTLEFDVVFHLEQVTPSTGVY
jgi:predicted ribosomally synthesized peptide with SipW-like signal peptide